MEYMQEANFPLTQNITLDLLKLALEDSRILCAKALVYEKNIGLRLNLSGYEAIIPSSEVSLTFTKEEVKEAAIVTRVNKNVCFIVDKIDFSKTDPVIYLSRKKAQEIAYAGYIRHIRSGDVIPCNITHIDNFGVFCDIGVGINALLPIDFISVSRIQSPHDRFHLSQNIFACVKSVDENGRIVLTHKELLGTWLENSKIFSSQSKATGIVRSIEDYGIFIELTPNLAGLAEVCEGIEIGDVVNVYIKSIIPDKMKIKLVIISKISNSDFYIDLNYFKTSGHIDYWKYSTENANKLIETQF